MTTTTSNPIPVENLVIRKPKHYQEMFSMEFKKDGKTNSWFTADNPDPLTFVFLYIGNISFAQAKEEIIPYLSKNFKNAKIKTEIHPLVYSKIDPAPTKAELDALQRVLPNAIIIISPQEILNQLCSVSFGLPSHVTRPELIGTLQKLIDNDSIIAPMGFSIATNRSSKSKFGSIFFLGSFALFTFINNVPSMFIGTTKINIEPRWNEFKIIPDLVQLHGWRAKSKIEISEMIEALGVLPNEYVIKMNRGQYVDFVIAHITRDKLPAFIHDVEVNLPGININIVTLESNLLEKKIPEQIPSSVDPNHLYTKLIVAQIETNKNLSILEGKTRKLFVVLKALQVELKTLKSMKTQIIAPIPNPQPSPMEEETTSQTKQGTKRTRSLSSSDKEKNNKKKGG